MSEESEDTHVCFPQYIFNLERIQYLCRDCNEEVVLTQAEWQKFVADTIANAK